MKNLIFILIFLLGFLSNNTTSAMANKAAYSTEQTIHTISRHKKVSYFEKVFSRKIGERKAIRLFTLPTRYVVNTIIMAVSQLQTSITEDDNWKPVRDYLIFLGCITIIGLATHFFIWLGFSFWLALLTGTITSLLLAFVLLITIWIILGAPIRC
jgi:hypothetical protein